VFVAVQIEQCVLQWVVAVEWNIEVFIVAYRSY